MPSEALLAGSIALTQEVKGGDVKCQSCVLDVGETISQNIALFLLGNTGEAGASIKNEPTLT